MSITSQVIDIPNLFADHDHMKRSPEATISAFDRDTAIRAVSDETFEGVVTDGWNALNGDPNGGYVLAVCLRGLQQRMPYPDLLVASAFFVRPTTPGPVQIRAETVRTGRRLATGQATLIQNGEPAIRAVASFTDLSKATGDELLRDDPPAMAPPDEMIDPVAGNYSPDLTLLDHVEYRMPEVPGWVHGRPNGDPRAEFWMRFSDGRTADPLSLPFLVDAFVPAVVELGALSSTVELTVYVRARPAPGWLACRATTRHASAGFHEEDFQIWDSRGQLVAQSRQLGLVRA